MQAPGPAGDPQPVYLFVGSDAGIERNPGETQYVAPGEEEQPRADVVVLMRLNEDGSASVVPVPRDLLVPREGKASVRLTLRLIDGPQAVVDGVCGALGIAADRFVSIDAPGFVTAIDTLGGIDADLPLPVRDSKADLELEAGAQVLDGQDALALVRSRHTEYLTDDGWVKDGDGAAARTQWSGLLLEQIRIRARTAGPATLARTAWEASDHVTVGGGPHPLELAKLARAQIHQFELPVEGYGAARAQRLGETAQEQLRSAGFATDCVYP